MKSQKKNQVILIESQIKNNSDQTNTENSKSNPQNNSSEL